MFYASATALYASMNPILILDFFFAVLFRFIVRRRLRRKLLLDDWLMIPVLLGVVGMAGIYLSALENVAPDNGPTVPMSLDSDLADPKHSHSTQTPENRIRLTRRVSENNLSANDKPH